MLGPGEEVSVATVSTDITLVDPYDEFVLNNDGSDYLNQGLARRRPEVRNHAISSRV